MTTPLPPSAPGPADPDMAEQAQSGFGIPSQDPRPGAQVALEPEEAQREARSVLVGGGMVAGAATGMTVGGAVGGPLGLFVGGTIGAVAGVLGGAGAGAMVTDEAAADPAQLPGPASPAEAVRLHIEDSGGSGRPVVLVHGWPLSAQAWEPQAGSLHAAGYRVVAYDRRGFGRSDKPETGYGYDDLADDLQRVLEVCGLRDVTLVGFSMGGGEVARYVARHGEERLHSVVFAAAVTPCLMQSPDNPQGPLTPAKAQEKRKALEQDRYAFFEQFTLDFYAADGVQQVTQAQRRDTLALCHQSSQHAALACRDAFSNADFRDDLKKVTVPTLVIHGSADAIVPFEASGRRTHLAVPHSRLVLVEGAPHGLNASHAPAFNEALLAFLRV